MAEYVDINHIKNKRDEYKTEITKLQQVIEIQKKDGTDYSIIQKNQNLLEYYKEQWYKYDSALGKEYSKNVSENMNENLEAREKSGELDRNDVIVNEEWAMNNHYRQIFEIERKINKINREAEKAENFLKKSSIELKKEPLEKELEYLKKYTRSDVIMFAKERKAAYLNAKKRYKKLSFMEKLKAGKAIEWEKIKDDNTYTTSKLDSMYHPRSR